LKLHYKQYGEGRPVVLLHGLLGSFENWHTVARSLEDAYRVIVPDLRNHGRSPHSGDISYPLLAEDMRELIDGLRLANPILVGHSMGGKTVMEFALRFPDVPKAVVVEDMVPGESEAVSGQYIRMLLELDIESAAFRRDVEEMLLRKIGNRRLALFLLKNLERKSDGTFAWRSNLKALAANYERMWKGLDPGRSWDGPAMFIRGGQSEVVTDDSYEEILSFFPRATILTISEAGHWVHVDGGPEFVSHLRSFFEDVENG
jgi:pimeloyl-ACP methyl ester carboxylesterase